MDSEALEEFRIREKLMRNIEKIKDYYKNDITLTYNEKINGYIRKKRKEIEKISKEIRLLESIKNQILKKDILHKGLVDIIKKLLAREIEKWIEPANNMNKKTKLVSFLNLYRYIKYYEEIEKTEKGNGNN